MGNVIADIREYLESCALDVERALDEVLPREDEPPATLHRAMRYSVFAGGKRLRPAMVLLSCEVCGGVRAAAMPAACAVEMVHTYSLIHDDLPCMDDDDLRRGKPTCHRAFGEATAVLAGDALLTAAPAVIAERVSDPAAATRLVSELCRAAGSFGMVGGQAADLDAEKREVTPEELASIHRRKTAALIAWSSRAGGICAGAGESVIRALGSYGEKIGLAFQIVDDILDVEGDAALLGKGAQKDIDRGKAVYPRVCGIAESRRLADSLVRDAIGLLPDFGKWKGLFEGLGSLVLARSS